MNAKQAHAVLRAVAEHALTMAPYLYGMKNADEATQVIREALSVDQTARNAKKDNPPST